MARQVITVCLWLLCLCLCGCSPEHEGATDSGQTVRLTWALPPTFRPDGSVQAGDVTEHGKLLILMKSLIQRPHICGKLRPSSVFYCLFCMDGAPQPESGGIVPGSPLPARYVMMVSRQPAHVAKVWEIETFRGDNESIERRFRQFDCEWTGQDWHIAGHTGPVRLDYVLGDSNVSEGGDSDGEDRWLP